MASYSFWLNQSNLVPTTANNIYTLNFSNTFDLRDKEVAVTGITIPYSWYNITALYGNNSFEYVWIDGSVNSVVYPDGGYNSAADLNSYLQYVMQTNGHYLINDTGADVFFLNIAVNPIAYGIEISSLVTPSSLPTGWSLPAGAGWSLNGYSPQFYLNNPAFNKFLGFNSTATYYPSNLGVQTGNLSFQSQNTPDFSTIQTVYLSTNTVNNLYSATPGVFFSFVPNLPYGNLLDIKPQQFLFCSCSGAGSQTNITVRFLDQNFRPLNILDTNLQIGIMVRTIGSRS